MPNQSDPVEMLRQEHELLLARLNVFELTLQGLAASRADMASTGSVIQFLTDVLVRHGRKEMECLFPTLAARGTDPGWHAIMALDLQMWDALLGLQDAWERLQTATPAEFPTFRARLAQEVSALAATLRQHVYEEETLLFALAGSTLDGPGKERVAAQMLVLDGDAGALGAA